MMENRKCHAGPCPEPCLETSNAILNLALKQAQGLRFQDHGLMTSGSVAFDISSEEVCFCISVAFWKLQIKRTMFFCLWQARVLCPPGGRAGPREVLKKAGCQVKENFLNADR